MKDITVAAILRRRRKWIASEPFSELIAKKRNVKKRQAYNLIKQASDNKEILKHVLSDRTVLYGLVEFGPPFLEGSQKYSKDDFLNFGILHGMITREDLKRLSLPIEKVPKMFTKGDRFFPIRLKGARKLDIHQLLVTWIYEDVYFFMHAARKIMAIKNALEHDKLTDEKAVEYMENWIIETKKNVADGWEGSLRWIAKEGKESWENILGSYEDDPLPLYQGLCEYERTLLKAEKEHANSTWRAPRRKF